MTREEFTTAVNDLALVSMLDADTIALALRDVMDEYEAIADEDRDSAEF